MCRRQLPVVVLLLLLLVLFFASSARAVDFGWQSLPDGGIEYLVQVEPDLLEQFRQQGFTSDIPASLQGQIHRIHISVGEAKLPNQGDVAGPKNLSSVIVPPSARQDVVPAHSDQPSSAPARSPSFEPNTSSPRTPSTAAPPSSSDMTQSPAGNTASNPDRLNLPPPPGMDESKANADSAPAELPKSLTSLPFLHPGQIKKLDSGNSPGSAPAAQNSQTSQPRLASNDAAPNRQQTFSSDQVAIGAGKPAVSDSGWVAEKPDNTPKPWLPLMGTLLALFASLGANAYLVWIHQSVRAKYRDLVESLPAGAATAVR